MCNWLPRNPASCYFLVFSLFFVSLWKLALPRSVSTSFPPLFQCAEDECKTTRKQQQQLASESVRLICTETADTERLPQTGHPLALPRKEDHQPLLGEDVLARRSGYCRLVASAHHFATCWMLEYVLGSHVSDLDFARANQADASRPLHGLELVSAIGRRLALLRKSDRPLTIVDHGILF